MSHVAELEFWIICCMLALAVFGVIAMSAWRGGDD